MSDPSIRTALKRHRPLAASIAGLFALGAQDVLAATTWTVNTCVDDTSGSGTQGSLRFVDAHAVSGDTIDFTTLQCSAITLTGGAVSFPQDNLILTGPGADFLSIDGAFGDRVFVHGGYGTLAIQGMTVTHGYYTSSNMAFGGCIFSKGSVSLIDSTVTVCNANGAGPVAYAYGGGVFTKGDLSLHSSTISNCTATGTGIKIRGGGAFVSGTLQTKYSTISNNTAAALPPSQVGSGGGLFTLSNVDIRQSTISANRAPSSAGWAASHGATTPAVSITNSTVSGNVTSDRVGGIGAYTPITIANSTIAFNQAALASGGLYSNGVTITLNSSIVADNINYFTGAQDDLDGLSGTTISGVDNLVTSASVALPPGTIVATCPRLGPLTNNGGATLTHALLQGSPAIDQGSASPSVTDDQRGPGFLRSFFANVDIGAYEWEGGKDDRIANSGFEISCDR